MRFEFDQEKSASNKKKHGIDFEEGQKLWRGEVLRSQFKMADIEPRYTVFGKIDGVFWTAIITMRGDAIRIISIRRSRDEEKDCYQKNYR